MCKLRRLFWFLLGIVVVASVFLLQLSGSKPVDNGETMQSAAYKEPNSGLLPPKQTVKLRVEVSVPASHFKLMAEQSKLAMSQFPHIQVTLINREDKQEAYAQWRKASEQRNAPDIMLLDNGLVLPLAVKGHLKPVDGALTGDFLAEQLSTFMEVIKWNNHHWAVPQGIDPYLVVWSKRLLATAGLEAPPISLDSLLDTCNQLLLQNQSAHLKLDRQEVKTLLVWLEQWRQLYKDDQIPSLANLGEWLDMEREFADWLGGSVDSILSRPVSSLHDDNQPFMQVDTLATVIPWSVYEQMNDYAQDAIVYESERITMPWLNGQSYVVAASSLAEEAAIIWIRQMTSTVVQQENYELLQQLPARVSLYEGFHTKEEGKLAPAWWLSLLNTKQPDYQLPLPEIDWPERWLLWSRSWKELADEERQLQLFIGMLNR